MLYRTEPDAEGGHGLLMLGWPQAAWHLELVGDPGGETPPSSTDEDLLVLYVGGPVDEEASINWSVQAASRRQLVIRPGTGGESPSSTLTDIASS